MAKVASTRRSRWTPEHAKQILIELGRSGLSLRAFAAGRGLDPERLYRWRRQLGRGRTSRRDGGLGPPGFTEVTTSGAPIAQYRVLGDGFEVVLRNGAIVRVGPSFEPQALRRLLSVMADADG